MISAGRHINMILNEMPWLVPQDGPVTVLARHHGRYIRPVQAHALDMRMEDNPEIPKIVMRNTTRWYARHPQEALYLTYDQGKVYSRVTPEELQYWVNQMSEEPYRLPEQGDAAWWEWVVAMDENNALIKAAKKPRLYEPTPDEIDERGGERPTLETRLERVFGYNLTKYS